MVKLPSIDTDYLLEFLEKLLTTPSPTGYTEEAISLTAEEMSKFPDLSVNTTRKGALVATWPGQ